MSKGSEILSKIRDCYELNNSEIAKSIGKSRQCISQIDLGKRNMSKDILSDLQSTYKEAFVENSVNCKNHIYKIPYCPKIQIPKSNDLYSNINETISVDKRLLSHDINPTHCRVVTLSDDSLSPVYIKGDKVIVDTSVTCLLDGLSYLILVNGNYYIRKIKILPNKIRCISTNNDEDTFTVHDNEIKAVGLIVPNLRF